MNIHTRRARERESDAEFLPAPTSSREGNEKPERALITREAAKIKARHVKGAEKLPSSLSALSTLRARSRKCVAREMKRGGFHASAHSLKYSSLRSFKKRRPIDTLDGFWHENSPLPLACTEKCYTHTHTESYQVNYRLVKSLKGLLLFERWRLRRFPSFAYERTSETNSFLIR